MILDGGSMAGFGVLWKGFDARFWYAEVAEGAEDAEKRG